MKKKIIELHFPQYYFNKAKFALRLLGLLLDLGFGKDAAYKPATYMYCKCRGKYRTGLEKI
jgi:hypothetical protein